MGVKLALTVSIKERSVDLDLANCWRLSIKGIAVNGKVTVRVDRCSDRKELESDLTI